MALLPPTAALPASLSAVVDSFNELLPGVPWNDSVVNTIKWEVLANACCIGFPVFVAHGDADVELEVHSYSDDAPAVAKVSVYWSLADGLAWEGTRPATKDGAVGPAAGDQASHQMPAARAMRNLRGTGPSAAQHASHTGRWLRQVRAQDLLASLSGTREEQPLLAAMPGRLLRRRAACPITRRLCVLAAAQQFFVRSLEHANVLRNPE